MTTGNLADGGMHRPRLAAVVYDSGQGPAADAIMTAVAHVLAGTGYRLAGAVQHNHPRPGRCSCDMTLEALGGDRLVEISEDRGPEARGCMLNPAALEEVVAIACRVLEKGARLLVVNRFGKQEADGRGFRQAIALSADLGVPVLVAVSRDQEPDWSAFCGGGDERLPLEPAAILDWCRSVVRRDAPPTEVTAPAT